MRQRWPGSSTPMRRAPAARSACATTSSACVEPACTPVRSAIGDDAARPREERRERRAAARRAPNGSPYARSVFAARCERRALRGRPVRPREEREIGQVGPQVEARGGDGHVELDRRRLRHARERDRRRRAAPQREVPLRRELRVRRDGDAARDAEVGRERPRRRQRALRPQAAGRGSSRARRPPPGGRAAAGGRAVRKKWSCRHGENWLFTADHSDHTLVACEGLPRSWDCWSCSRSLLAPGAGRDLLRADRDRPRPAGLRRRRRPATRRRLYVVEQRRRGSRSCATAPSPERSSTSATQVGRATVSTAFCPSPSARATRQNHLFYVDYTDLERQHARRRVRARAATPTYKRELLVVQQPYPNHKGGQLEFDRNGLPLRRHGRRRHEPALATPRPAIPRTARRIRRAASASCLRIDPSKPAATWQMVGTGPAQPVALLVRPHDGQPLDRRRRRGALRGDRLPDGAPSSARCANYGWSHLEGTALYNAKVALARGAAVVAPTFVLLARQRRLRA